MSDPQDLELDEIALKVKEMIKWLDEVFVADCAEEDYTDGCASCNAGMAIKHMRKILAVVDFPKPNDHKE